MARTILITGGAGFLGSHVADDLIGKGHKVRVLDNLSEQVHGPGGERPDYLDPDIELIRGDVRDPDAVRAALQGVDAVYHFAALVGVGQSMYQIGDYVGVNDLGTAVLMQALIERPVERLVVASSMSVYGEGLYQDAHGHVVEAGRRSIDQLKAGHWEPGTGTGGTLTPLATPETKAPDLASVYALNKYVQERMCLIVGETYDIPTVALRFFNAYGTRQALSNPYTGVLAIFASRILNGKPPLVFEDGQQRRDFVHVHDVARACRMALDAPGAAGQTINVASGRCVTVAEVAEAVATAMNRPDLKPEIPRTFRAGDIRHCFADIGKARELLGFTPIMDFNAGLQELAGWVAGQTAVDRVDDMRRELAQRGLSA
ncbi:NAD-dependent epimerase/dehydratase family protein [Azospirillum thermophilum]|uniref:Nucleoside-diphosphate-sugar epimerase n=1 Tax=Azospirillum thermophilum TaxID=2202148 RepID=A0A2S2CUV1_9PROT|nr:NAD-dependent epimerase/dehydratase family protein [Azospirillum thermophilum]AWK88150.1 nucleoside-diphosphate-sugar epimerase [Azospirillum thermophilum]